MNSSFFLLFSFAVFFLSTTSVQIKVIKHAVFTPISTSNFTILQNRSKDECCCFSVSNSVKLMNYFDNGTCQLFTIIPCAYQINLQSQTYIYLFNESVSLIGRSCAENLTHLIYKLNNAIVTNIYSQGPRCLFIDDNGYLATALYYPPFLNRYDPVTMTLINQTSLNDIYTLTITLHDGAYYIGAYSGDIQILNSTNLAIIGTITSLYLDQPRDIIFINNGYTMIVASSYNNRLVFFNRSDTAWINYTYIYYISFSYDQPHGLFRVNDSFFYATSYGNNIILSYTAINSTSWMETLVADARSILPAGNGVHVTVDRYGRLWFSLEGGGALIYDQQGVLLGSFSFPSVYIYDLLISNNFVIYISSYFSNQLLRLDPQIDV